LPSVHKNIIPKVFIGYNIVQFAFNPSLKLDCSHHIGGKEGLTDSTQCSAFVLDIQPICPPSSSSYQPPHLQLVAMPVK